MPPATGSAHLTFIIGVTVNSVTNCGFVEGDIWEARFKT